MTRTEYNQRVIARKKKSTLIKGSLGIAAFLMFASIVGHIDSDTYAGIHSVKGTVPYPGTISLMKMVALTMYPDSRADPK